jgi:hypothetical protein
MDSTTAAATAFRTFEVSGWEEQVDGKRTSAGHRTGGAGGAVTLGLHRW